MPLLSGLLDFLLSVVCLAIAVASLRARNELFFSGMLWIAVAAFVGAFRLAGWEGLAAAHAWLSDVGRGPGMLALAIGVLAALYGARSWTAWGATALAIVGAASVTILADSPALNLFTTLLGATLLLALLLLAWYAWREGRRRAAIAAVAAVLLFLFAGIGVGLLPLAQDGALRAVDVLHVVLAACYTLAWLAVRGMTRVQMPN